MKGTVKWFSEEKGYGFIVGEDGVEHHFNVRSIVGATLPNNGALVEFTSEKGNKGPRAVNVEIQQQTSKNNDDRVECPNCKKRIVPRIITDRGSVSRSVCPFCGGTVKNFNPFGFWLVVGVIIIFLVIGNISSGK
jgi:cold shock CspA family protein